MKGGVVLGLISVSSNFGEDSGSEDVLRLARGWLRPHEKTKLESEWKCDKMTIA